MSKVMMQRKSKELSIEAALDLFRAYKLSEGMKGDGYCGDVEYILRFTTIDSGTSLAALNKNTVDEIKINLHASKLSPASMNHYLTSLRVFCYWCMRNGYLEEYKISLFKKQEEKIKFFTEEEIGKLIIKPSSKCLYREARTYTILCFIMATGARASTICDLRVEDIDFINKEITYRHLKNKKLAIIPLSPSLEKELRQYISDWPIVDYLFTDAFGNKLTVSALRQGIKQYCIKRGVKPRGPHAIRHTFAREYIKNGGNAFTLQQVMCHSDITMTKKYVRLFSDDLKRGYENVSPLDNLKPKRSAMHRV